MREVEYEVILRTYRVASTAVRLHASGSTAGSAVDVGT